MAQNSPAGLQEGSDRSSERRQVTALSYDLVGSTQLISRLDPEDMREVQNRFHEVCTGAVRRYGGFLESYTGDGAMAFYGYPDAQEDASERAILSGLGIVSACQGLNDKPMTKGVQLAVRVGIATGVVVAKEIDSKRIDLVGMALNLAFKLQACAAPNSIVVSSTTHELTSLLFEFEPQSDLVLTGVSERQQVWRVLRARQLPTRFRATRTAASTPLLARETELNTIAERLRLSLRGAGHVILLTGEPGIGKSRLASWIHQHIEPRSHLRIVLQCSSQHRDTALHPVVTRLERLLNVTSSEASERISKRLARLLASTGASEELWPLIARLLSLPVTLPSASPEIVKERTFSALLVWLNRLSDSHPILLIIEDVHWADPTSWELLNQLVASVSARPIFIIVTSRSENLPVWANEMHVTWLPLSRLSKDHSTTIVKHISRGHTLPAYVIEQIVARSDGVPLFAEELSRAVLGALESRGHASDAAESVSRIPSTLADSLATRLDQLGSFKQIAQVGSAIGRSFSFGLLDGLAVFDKQKLNSGLARLVEIGLADVRGQDERALYTFKHSLIQGAAYESMARAWRAAVHQRIAEVLEKDYAGSREAAPEILGHHFAEAGLFDRAVSCFGEAGEKAAAESASIEARRLFERALQLLSNTPDNLFRNEKELSLLASLGPVLISTSGAGASEVEALYRRAVHLSSTVSDSKLRFVMHWGWWRISPNALEMRRRADQLLSLAETQGELELRLQAHHCQWATLFNLGEFENCVQHIRSGISIYEDGDYHAHGTLYGGHDPKACAYGELALALWLMGFPVGAVAAIKDGISHAEQLRHAGSIGHVRDIEIMLARHRGDAAELVAKADMMISFAEAQSFRDLAAKALLFKGWALGRLGQTDAGIELMEEGIAALWKIDTQEDFPIYYEMLAELHGHAGQIELAMPLVDEAISIVHRSGVNYWLAELYRRKGELLLSQDLNDVDAAMNCFERAIGIAVNQKATALMLRAATSRARLLRQLGRGVEGREQLSMAYASLTEGFESPDAVAARLLLSDLS